MTDYPLDMQLLVDPLNPENVVRNGTAYLYDPSDEAGVSPIAIKDPSGLPLPNPLTSNAFGFTQPCIVTIPRVKWKSGTFEGFFYSYDGLRNEAIEAKTAAQAAAANAAAAAKSDLDARIAAGQFKGEKGADGSNVLPTDTAIAAAVNGAGPTKAALNSTIGTLAPPKVSSPRDTARVKQERKAVFLVDQIAPNANYSHKIVWAEGATLWSYGQDYSLRKSTDKGQTWGAALSNSLGSTIWAKDGLFFKTSAGTLITTSDPADLSAPKIIRSTDGITWTDVIPAKTSVGYLGVTNICQDPVTGYLYIAEYVTATAAVKATWEILRSTDDGATWTTFHTFQRDAAAYPTTAVRHGHAVQWDQFSQRIYFLTGDAEAAAGIYRVNAAGTGIEKVVLNGETQGGNLATAVGIMFFPNYLAWGMDQTSDSWLLRMKRDQIGAATAASVEKIGRVQSTAWYTARVAADGTEWLMAVSNETSVGRVDAAVHVYRVADDAATMDEVLTLPTPNDTTFSRAYPIGTPLQTGASAGYVWLGTNIQQPFTSSSNLARGQQIAGILGWGGQALQQTSSVRLPHGAPTTQSSGQIALASLETKYFGVTEAPIGATRLYIIDAGATTFDTGLPYITVYDQTGAAVLKAEDGTTLLQWQSRSVRAAKNQGSAPYVFRSARLAPGRQIRFSVIEGAGTAMAAGAAYVTYAWGY
jgi:hypothetical protein